MVISPSRRVLAASVTGKTELRATAGRDGSAGKDLLTLCVGAWLLLKTTGVELKEVDLVDGAISLMERNTGVVDDGGFLAEEETVVDDGGFLAEEETVVDDGFFLAEEEIVVEEGFLELASSCVSELTLVIDVVTVETEEESVGLLELRTSGQTIDSGGKVDRDDEVFLLSLVSWAQSVSILSCFLLRLAVVTLLCSSGALARVALLLRSSGSSGRSFRKLGGIM